MATVVHFVQNRDESIVVQTQFEDAVNRLEIARERRDAGMSSLVRLELQTGRPIAIPEDRIEYLEER